MTNAMTSGLMGPADTVEWGTPKDLFDRLDAEFHFTLDVCASDGMQMVPRYFNPQTDGLAQEWGGGRSMLDEPTLRTGDHKVGAQGGTIPGNHGGIIASPYRYALVSGVGPALRIRSALYQRTGKIQRGQHRRAIPLDYRDLQYAENAEIWSD